ncbi:MAG: hypothetical protein IJ735_00955 [Clostridia bacterium]|nr:hypothetical protein [Clostridia bacterium]
MNRNKKEHLKNVFLLILLMALVLVAILSFIGIIKVYVVLAIEFGAIIIYLSIKSIINSRQKKKANEKLLEESKTYRSFKSTAEIEEWAINKYGKSFLDEIKGCYPQNAEDPHGIGWYKGNYFGFFNDFPQSQQSKILNNYVNSFSLDENIIAYRFCSQDEYDFLFKQKNYFLERFLSTTLLPELFNGNIITKEKLIKIIIPQNTHGLYLPNRSPNDLEFEILLPCNLTIVYIGETEYNNNPIKTYIIRTQGTI